MKRLVLLIALLMPFSAHSMDPDELVLSPAQETEAREIFQKLRCPACTHQSLMESDADIAKDIRVLIRDKIKQGHPPDQIVALIVATYGESVLIVPAAEDTPVLWYTPLVVFILAAGAIAITFRRNRKG